MKLRNKKTGEIGYCCFVEWDSPDLIIMDRNGAQLAKYNSLAELNEEWEDVPEEPKAHWCVTMYGGITRIKDDEEPIDDLIEIGNYFNSKEDAYDAWEKLKAWKRLKDKGVKIVGWDYSENVDLNGCKFIDEDMIIGITDGYNLDVKDLDLLFGGEK